MKIIDCHAHLSDPEFDSDIDEVIDRAQKAGVVSTLVVTENIRNFKRTLELAEKFPTFIKPCLGVHPVQVLNNLTLLDTYLQEESESENRSVNLDDFSEAEKFIEENIDKIYGIGEVGLDFTPRWCPDATARESQIAVLTAQVHLAQRHHLAVNVHSRSAGRPTVELLRELGATNVHLHAFDGRVHYALQAVQLGYFLSIPPCVVRSDQKRKLVEAIPLDNLLIETDSPVLGPNKQERNEPANAAVVCKFVSDVKKVDLETVIRITTENALKVYPRLKTDISE